MPTSRSAARAAAFVADTIEALRSAIDGAATVRPPVELVEIVSARCARLADTG